jgi:hypothetical protein
LPRALDGAKIVRVLLGHGTLKIHQEAAEA